MKEHFKLNPEDEKIGEKLLKEAKSIIASPSKQNILEESRLEREEEDRMLLDETSDFLINVEKGTNLELYYKTLAEELPDLGLFFEENTKNNKGYITPNITAVKAIPFQTDRNFIDDLRSNPVISLFTNPSMPAEEREKLGNKLESMAVLPVGTTDRFLSRVYNEKVKNIPQMKDVFNARYAKYIQARPLSDEEMREFLRKEIREEYENRF